MKKYLQLKFLPLFVLAASLLGLILRIITIIPGADADGLYPSRPVTWVLLWLVTLAALAGIFLLSSRLKNPGRYSDNFPKSIPGAIGCAAAALAVLVAGVQSLLAALAPQVAIPGALISLPLLGIVTGLLGMVSAACLGFTAFCRFTGKKTHFLTHAIPCLYFALRVFDCCRAWSNETQSGVFIFQFLASVCVMLAAYQLCCYDVNLGNRRNSLFWSLSALYFCALTLPVGEDLLFYVCMGLWLATNLCSIRPLKAKAQETAETVEIPQPIENPAVDAPAAEAAPISEAAPAAEEKPLASYAEILSQLEQE